MSSEDTATEDDMHAPWHYTEYGVICACGAAMDADERCTSLDQPKTNDAVRQQVTEILDSYFRQTLRIDLDEDIPACADDLAALVDQARGDGAAEERERIMRELESRIDPHPPTRIAMERADTLAEAYLVAKSVGRDPS